MDPELVTNLLNALVALVIGVLGYAARELIAVGVSYLKSKLGSEQFMLLRDYVESVVRSLAQNPAYEDLSGEKLKEIALVKTQDFVKTNKLGFTYDYCDDLIEAVYSSVKIEFEKFEEF